MNLDNSLRQWSLIIIVLGAILAIPTLLLTLADDTKGGGADILSGMIFSLGVGLIPVGIILFIIDWVLRMTGRKF